MVEPKIYFPEMKKSVQYSILCLIVMISVFVLVQNQFQTEQIFNIFIIIERPIICFVCSFKTSLFYKR